MSNSQFDEKDSLGLGASPNIPNIPPGGTFKVSGTLETDEESVEERKVHVFVIVEQTTGDASGTKKAEARGYKLFSGPANTLKKWRVVMTVQRGKFEPGPATGTALMVEFSDDPIGFETYTWTERITLER